MVRMSNTAKPTEDSPTVAPVADGSMSHWGRGVRDTIEAFAIAFALAFLFKAFEAEAFVIPTGSMAPTLMGRHKDVVCPECGYAYTASCSEEADENGNLLVLKNGQPDPVHQVVECTCPNCRFTMSVDPNDAIDGEFELQKSYSGDRIWVSKVPYQFSEPRRWDVIVFRCPQKAETYFIKRLVGLPNERLLIQNGDVSAKGPADGGFKLMRKPPDKIRAVAQVVYDNDYVSPTLVEAGWPARWSNSPQPAETKGAWKPSDDGRNYSADGSAGETWLRYENRVPTQRFWDNPDAGDSAVRNLARPQLITDFYAFNTRVTRGNAYYGMPPSALGLHWVGDLLVECEADVRSTQGELLLDLVKGGRHFRCAIDVATGSATLSIDGLPEWKRTAQTSLRGPGQYELRFANVDRQLVLWIDNDVVAFDQPAEYGDLHNDHPVSNDGDPGDLVPIGIGSRGAAIELSHLRGAARHLLHCRRQPRRSRSRNHRLCHAAQPGANFSHFGAGGVSVDARPLEECRRLQPVRRSPRHRVRLEAGPVLRAGRQQPAEPGRPFLARRALRGSEPADRQSAVHLLAASDRPADSAHRLVDRHHSERATHGIDTLAASTGRVAEPRGPDTATRTSPSEHPGHTAGHRPSRRTATCPCSRFTDW